MNRADRRQLRREGLVCEHGRLKKTDGTGTPMCPHWCGFEHLRPRWPSLATVLGQHPDVTHNSYENPRMYGDPACGCGWQELNGDWRDHFTALWRELRTIRTREQLDALPPQTVIQSDPDVTRNGQPWTWERFSDGWFTTGYDPAGIPDLPALLLRHPDWVRS